LISKTTKPPFNHILMRPEEPHVQELNPICKSTSPTTPIGFTAIQTINTYSDP